MSALIMDLNVWLPILCLLIKSVYSQEYSIASQRLEVFPTNDIPADTVVLLAYDNDFMTFPADAFDHLYQLEELHIDNNPFTVFPDITAVGGTLKFLSVYLCQVPIIDLWIFDKLVVLEQLIVTSYITIEIPNVLAPANTFKDLTWRYYNAPNFPILSNYKALEILDLSGAQITTINPGDLDGLDSLRTFYLWNVPITPDPDLSSISDTLIYLNIRLAQVPTFRPEETMLMTTMKDLHLDLNPDQVITTQMVICS